MLNFIFYCTNVVHVKYFCMFVSSKRQYCPTLSDNGHHKFKHMNTVTQTLNALNALNALNVLNYEFYTVSISRHNHITLQGTLNMDKLKVYANEFTQFEFTYEVETGHMLSHDNTFEHDGITYRININLT